MKANKLIIGFLSFLFFSASSFALASCGLLEEKPTAEPTVEPTIEPTIEPTVEPTVEPTPEPHVHDWDEWKISKEATCTTNGEMTYTCSGCGEIKVDVITATGHDYIDEVTEPTCTIQGYTTHKCEICNYSYVDTYVAATGHKEVIDSAVEATCTETGLTEGKHCSECGLTLVYQQILVAKGHKEVIDAAVDATCLETGLTEGKHCSTCKEVLVAQQKISAKGHKEVIDAAVDATCLETGLTEGKHCSTCNEILVAQEVVRELGHNYQVSDHKDATCEEDGHTTYVCSHDSTHTYTDVHEAVGHSEVIDAAVAPTYTETGLTEGSHCSVCNVILIQQQILPTLPPVEDQTTKPIIELARQVYIEGEDASDDLLRFDVWSNAFKEYISRLNSATVEMPDECHNGLAYITISYGNDSVEYPIYYYKDAATAAEMTEIEMPEDVSSIFNEAAYINSKGKLQFKYSVGDNGELFVERAGAGVMYIDSEIASLEFNTNNLELWKDTSKMVPSVYDTSKFTLPHYVEEGVGDHYHVTYLPAVSSVAPSNINSYEIILDAAGRVCYFAPIYYSSANWQLAHLDTGYWSVYKDYVQNPAFVFAEDYDPETNPEAFQKVIPEGGKWIIGYNINGSEVGYIDSLWQAMSGTRTTIFSAKSNFQLTMEDPSIEASLMGSRLSYGSRRAKVSTLADTYELYAYYYSLALAANDEALLAYRDDIYEAIIKQGLPEVQAEPILFNYYKSITMSKLAEWGTLFNIAQ